MTLLQFSENLSDRRAADAVRSRFDWKYLLGLSMKDPGFDASVLSEFRSRLVKGGAESLLFDRLFVLCREQGPLAQHGRQRTDSTHVLGAVRTPEAVAHDTDIVRVDDDGRINEVIGSHDDLQGGFEQALRKLSHIERPLSSARFACTYEGTESIADQRLTVGEEARGDVPSATQGSFYRRIIRRLYR